MAERVTVATLTIDEQGAVRSVNNLVGAEKKLDAQTKTTSDAFTARMFNMRSAAAAFLGGFTLAGAIFQLRELATAVITSSDAWAAYSKSADAAGKRTANLLADLLGITAALEGTTPWLNRLERLAGVAKGQNYQGPTAFGIIGTLLWGSNYNLFKQALEGVGGLIDKALPTEAKPGIADPWAVSDWEKALKAVEERNNFLSKNPTAGFNPKIQGPPLAQRIDQGVGFGEPLQYAWPEIPDDDALARWEEALELQERQIEFWEQQGNVIVELTNHYAEYGAVASAAGDAVAAAAQSGIVSQGTAARISAAIIAAEATIRGMFELPAAAASAASYDYRGAVLHKIAAGLYFATAAFKGAGAFGAGGTGADRAVNAGRFQQVNQAQPVRPEIHLYLEGTLSDVRVRELTGGVVKAITDGVGGSQLAVVPA